MTKVLVINGPSLGRLGTRDPEKYGSTTYPQLMDLMTGWGKDLGLELDFVQSESEAEILTAMYGALDDRKHVVINAGAFSHYAYSLGDAAAMITQAGLTLIEVHLSNVMAREEFRHVSVLARYATGGVFGLGIHSYHAALVAIAGRTTE